MTTTQKTAAVVGLIVLGLLLALLFWYRSSILPAPTGTRVPEGSPAEGKAMPKTDALPTVEGGTRSLIKTDIQTPEAGMPDSTSTAGGTVSVAVPELVITIQSSGTGAALRQFSLVASSDRYAPSTIVVNELDVITIEFIAEDKAYNVFFPDFGIYHEAKKGETKRIQFQAYPYGQYSFFCKDCAVPMTGTLIVNQKQSSQE